MHNIERKVPTYVLHVPTGPLGGNSAFALHEMKGPKLTCARSTIFASSYRTAVSTCTTWHFGIQLLSDVAFKEN